MNNEAGLLKTQVISLLAGSPHGKLEFYTPLANQAAAEDPGFFAHLISWNRRKGSVRDAQVALPVIALTTQQGYEDIELRENALAHIAQLAPRDILRALAFSRTQPVKSTQCVARLVKKYVRHLEAKPRRFERVALQHRDSLVDMYCALRMRPADFVRPMLGFRTAKGQKNMAKTGVFAEIGRLKDMAPLEAAGFIMERKIPFLTAMGGLGAKSKDPEVVQALIGVMSSTELVTNAKRLEKLGVKTNPALRAAFEAGVKRVAETSSTQATLKTTRAAEVVGGALGEKLRGAQEKQLDRISVEGNWLVLADKSGSMKESIVLGREAASLLSRVAKGTVWLVFFDATPNAVNVTGLDYDAIVAKTRLVSAGGGTACGVGLQWAHEKGFEADGIAIISDGGERASPDFSSAYKAYCAKLGKDVPAYFYKVPGSDPDSLSVRCAAAGVDIQVFDLTRGPDSYSLPALIATMRTNRYSLTDEILNTPLLRLEDVFAPDRAA